MNADYWCEQGLAAVNVLEREERQLVEDIAEFAAPKLRLLNALVKYIERCEEEFIAESIVELCLTGK